MAKSKLPEGTIHNPNRLHRKSFSLLDRLAIWVTNNVGSMGFFLLVVIWTIGWFGWNTLGPAEHRFDPFPAFVLWLFISNVLQIMLMPLIMVGQNLQNRHAELRADSDYKTNLQAEKEIREILNYLERHDKILERLIRD